jgi:hypothetical protein
MADDEVPQLLRLWEEAGWGQVPAENWMARHREGPHGPSRVEVAVDHDGSLLGQVTVLRVALNVRGITVPAGRLFGLVMSPRFRKASGYVPLPRHPLRRMLDAAIQGARDEGAVTVYTMPDKRVLRLAPLVMPSAKTARFPFWSRPIHPLPEMVPGHETVPVVTPEDIDAVWARCRPELVCPVRDARTLAWKNLFATLRLEGIARHGELVAIVASRAHGDRQWMVEDLLAVDDDAFRAAITSVVHAAAAESADRELRKVGALVVPSTERAFAGCGFAADDFTFNVLSLPLTATLSAEDVDPARWHLTPND